MIFFNVSINGKCAVIGFIHFFVRCHLVYYAKLSVKHSVIC